MTEWQPIETAPKDGTTLLLNGPHTEYPMLGYYDLCDGGWVATNPRWVLGPEVHIPDPTQWRPAPEARK